MSDVLDRLYKVAPISDHRDFATVRIDLIRAAITEIETLQSSVNRYRTALHQIGYPNLEHVNEGQIMSKPLIDTARNALE